LIQDFRLNGAASMGVIVYCLWFIVYGCNSFTLPLAGLQFTARSLPLTACNS
jgi:hypothetical protein